MLRFGEGTGNEIRKWPIVDLGISPTTWMVSWVMVYGNCRTKEHCLHLATFIKQPVRQALVEGNGRAKHFIESGAVGDAPVANGRVEARSERKHLVHGPHRGGMPLLKAAAWQNILPMFVVEEVPQVEMPPSKLQAC